VELRLNTGTRIGDLVDVSGEPAGAGSARGEAGAATFDADLRLLRRRVVRRWALAVAGRYAIAALAVAVVPALLAAFGLIGWVWAIGVPAGLFVVALAVRLARPPSLTQVARLLDDRLGLFDVTATALQVERAGGPVDEGAAAPVFAEAAALLRAGASTWRPRARIGTRALAAAGGLVVVLAAIVLIGTSGGGSSAERVAATASPPGRHHAAGGGNTVSPPLVPPRAKRKGAKGPANPAKRYPYGLYDYGFEGKRQLPRYKSKNERSGVHYAGGGPPGSRQTPSQFAAPDVGEGNEAREKAEAEATKADAQPGAQGENERGNAPPPPRESLKSLTGGAVPPSGSVSPVPNAGGHPSAGNQTSNGPSSSSAPGQRSTAGAPGRQGGGRPSGSRTAGTERATLAGGEKGAEGGRTTGELALKAGFAAVRSGKAATGHGPRNAQGAGGPGRSAGIGGAAFEEAAAGSLGYVPPDAGVAPTLDPGLFSRYLNALAAIQGRRW
jgi:hypothetical protein